MSDRLGYPSGEVTEQAVSLFVLPSQLEGMVDRLVGDMGMVWARRAFYEFLWRMPNCDYPFMAVGVLSNSSGRPEPSPSTAVGLIAPEGHVVEFVRVRSSETSFLDEKEFSQQVARLRENLKWDSFRQGAKIRAVECGQTIDANASNAVERMRTSLNRSKSRHLVAFLAARVSKG